MAETDNKKNKGFSPETGGLGDTQKVRTSITTKDLWGKAQAKPLPSVARARICNSSANADPPQKSPIKNDLVLLQSTRVLVAGSRGFGLGGRVLAWERGIGFLVMGWVTPRQQYMQ